MAFGKAKIIGPAPSETYPAVYVSALGKRLKIFMRSWAGNGRYAIKDKNGNPVAYIDYKTLKVVKAKAA
jgi:hypothetical protein